MKWLDDCRNIWIRILDSRLWSDLRTKAAGFAASDDPDTLIRRLLLFAVIAAVAAFIVDQVVFWTRADHRYWMMKPWRLFAGKPEAEALTAEKETDDVEN